MTEPAKTLEPVVMRLPTAPLVQMTPADYVAEAIAKGHGVEVLKPLMELQERWERNQERKAYANAIAKAQAEIPVIEKNRTVSFGAGRAAYKHEDLAEIERTVKPILAKYGLSYRWRTRVDGNMLHVTCIVWHEDGYSEETTLPGPADTSGSKNAIQAIGSTQTYLERYTLKAALGLSAAQDDDGNAASRANGNGSSENITPEQAEALRKLLKEKGRTEEQFCTFAKLDRLEDLPANRYEAAVAKIRNATVTK